VALFASPSFAGSGEGGLTLAAHWTTGSLPRPRRRFGQHFLADQRLAEQIVDLVRPNADDQVLEIGPGRGALTRHLIAKFERLIVVEIDRDLVAFLRREYAQTDLHLIEADILKLDLRDVRRREKKDKLVIVGNLPYNISAPLLFHLLGQADCIRSATLMLQREVAQRLAARPGSKEYGLLTVMLSRWADMEEVLQVGPRAFRPVPKIQSSVVELQFRQTRRCPVEDEAMFERLVRAAFAQRRKMLRNSLLSLAAGMRPVLEEVGSQAEIDLARRPEDLNLEEFSRLSDAFSASELKGGM
tara:strand:+ start:42 stop:941 length:900 start_codon:yes stop_codon:yes gene_type:complete